MERKSRCEPSLSDSLWFSNLQLLGYGDQPSAIPFSPTMFDYPNPVAFQQVFFYLFGLLNQERTRMEFRDCWPILDKRQEAEFRRKVVNTVKEYQKEFPLDLPYTNPSLFQSPGGRRFFAFLQTFSNFVLKMHVEKSNEVLSKPNTKNDKLRRAAFLGLVKSTRASLESGISAQAELKKIVQESELSIQQIGVKYFDIKNFLEEAPENDLNEVISMHSEVFKNGKVDKMKLLKSYDEKCIKVKELQDALKDGTSEHDDVWDNIMVVVDDSLPKPKLNFDEFPPELVAVDNLKMTYQNLITKVLSTGDRALQFKPQGLPIKEMFQGAATFTSQAQQLTELQADLGMTVGKMMENVQIMLHTSSQIDWLNCELAFPSSRSRAKTSDQTVLLPPTPSLLDNLQKQHPDDVKADIPSHLQLLSPSPTTPHPNLTVPAGAGLTVTPISTGQVTRRFPRRITPDQSPLLRQSLIQSTLLRAGEDDRKQESGKSMAECPSQDSRSSLSVFSPVLSSNKSPQNTFSRPSSSLGLTVDSRPSSALGLSTTGSSLTTPSPSFGSLRAVAEASLDLDCTQSKIEMYKKILLSAKTKDKPANDGKPSLLCAWNVHRQSLTPQARPVTLSSSSSSSSPSSPPTPHQFSPMLGSRTPDMSHRLSNLTSPAGLDMDSKLASRLDQLMTSLTLSDTSLDFSLGRMSLGGEELLSPHCP